jgi:hypothetical protein
MRKFHGGHSVGKGTYWNSKYGSLVEMKREGVLPGGPNTVYYRIHIATLFFLVMTLGALYVILLPLIINAYAISLLGKRMLGGVLARPEGASLSAGDPRRRIWPGRARRRKTANPTPNKEAEDREMHTYVDFITHVKGVEYLLSVLSIVGFILFLEILKPKPFRTLIQSTRDDLDHMRKNGYGDTSRTMMRMMAGPFLGLLYVILFPFIFLYALGAELLRMGAEAFEKLLGMAGKTAFFGWRPMEAYFGGKRGKKGSRKKKEKEEAKGAGEGKEDE